MRCKFSCLAAAALAAGLGGPAWADVSARAELSHFGYRLIDLDPDDGIAPAIEFDLVHFRTGVGAGVSEALWSDGDIYGHAGRSAGWSEAFQLFATASRAVASPHAAASARMSGNVEQQGFSTVVEGHARNEPDDPRFFSTFEASAEPASNNLSKRDMRAFSLTPFTQVVWSGRLAVEAVATLDPGQRERVQSAGAGATLELHDATGGLIDGFTGAVEVRRYRPVQRSESFDIGLSFSNASAQPSYGWLHSRVYAQGRSFAPVPEAGTPWLLLCGLVALAGVLRRRQAAWAPNRRAPT